MSAAKAIVSRNGSTFMGKKLKCAWGREKAAVTPLLPQPNPQTPLPINLRSQNPQTNNLQNRFAPNLSNNGKLPPYQPNSATEKNQKENFIIWDFQNNKHFHHMVITIEKNMHQCKTE